MSVLIQASAVPITTPALFYTCPMADSAGKTVQYVTIDAFTSYNGTASPVELKVYIVPSTTALAAIHIIEDVIVPIATSFVSPMRNMIGHDLAPGDTIWAVAATASALTIRASGRLRT